MDTPVGPGTATDQIDSIVQSLRRRLAADIETSAIAAAVETELAAYSTARITQFVSILVESRARARLSRKQSV